MESTSLLMKWQSKYYYTENVINYFKGNLLWRCSAHVQTVFFDFLLTFQNKPVPGCCVQSVQFRICSIISSTVFISVEIFLLIFIFNILKSTHYSWFDTLKLIIQTICHHLFKKASQLLWKAHVQTVFLDFLQNF